MNEKNTTKKSTKLQSSFMASTPMNGKSRRTENRKVVSGEILSPVCDRNARKNDILAAEIDDSEDLIFYNQNGGLTSNMDMIIDSDSDNSDAEFKKPNSKVFKVAKRLTEKSTATKAKQLKTSSSAKKSIIATSPKHKSPAKTKKQTKLLENVGGELGKKGRVKSVESLRKPKEEDWNRRRSPGSQNQDEDSESSQSDTTEVGSRGSPGRSPAAHKKEMSPGSEKSPTRIKRPRLEGSPLRLSHAENHQNTKKTQSPSKSSPNSQKSDHKFASPKRRPQETKPRTLGQLPDKAKKKPPATQQKDATETMQGRPKRVRQQPTCYWLADRQSNSVSVGDSARSSPRTSINEPHHSTALKKVKKSSSPNLLENKSVAAQKTKKPAKTPPKKKSTTAPSVKNGSKARKPATKSPRTAVSSGSEMLDMTIASLLQRMASDDDSNNEVDGTAAHMQLPLIPNQPTRLVDTEIFSEVKNILPRTVPSGSGDGDFRFCPNLQSPVLSCGLLRLEPGVSKGRQVSTVSILVFFIATSTTLEVKINDACSSAYCGQSFWIPPGVSYDIKNVSSTPALLHYVTIKVNNVVDTYG